MKSLIGLLSVATLAVVLAAPLAAQTIKVTADVPFDFMVAGRALPAGDYRVSADPAAMSGVRVRGGNSGVLALANRTTSSPEERTGQALLIFHRYGEQYFLSRIVDGYLDTGVEIPTSRIEKELSKTASTENFETVAILARR
jgi:hypothetical protein